MGSSRVVVNTANLSEPLLARLREHAEVVVTGNEPAELRRTLADADAAILNKFARVTSEALADAHRLRAIATVSAGTEHVDLEAAAGRGIRIISGAGVNSAVVAEYVLGATIAAHRDFLPMHLALTSGSLSWPEKNTRVGTAIGGTTLGLIGFGHVGRSVAERAVAGFGMSVLVFDPYLAGPLPVGVEQVTDLDELLERSLTVSVHAALTPATEGLIGREELRRIGADGVLVQAARGRIVVEDALVAALEAGDIKAAVIDVFSKEPPSQDLVDRLAGSGRALLTPHMAGMTRGMIAAQLSHAVDGVVGALVDAG